MKNSYYLISLGCCLLLAGCNVLFEEDLSKKKVEMLSPPNGYRTSTQTQVFIWDELEVVDSYRVQIVADSFEYILRYVVDTIVKDNELTVTLLPDDYEWRVIGLNSSSETDFNEYKLIITTDTSLVGQRVNQLFPQENQIYTTDSVAFFWDALLFAQSYQLQIATDPSFNSQLIRQDIIIPNDFYYSVNTLGTGDYYWRIRALRNNIDTTVWSVARSFNINAIPQLQNPANNSVLSLPFSMSWSSSPSVQRDSLYLFFENEPDPYRTLGLNGRSYIFASADTVGKGFGTYYWQVRSLSASGFLTSTSNLRSFQVN